MKSSLKRYIQPVFSIILLIVLVTIIDLKPLLKIKISLSPTITILLFSLLIFTLICRSSRWFIIMNFRQNYKISHFNSFKFMLVGQALNIVMPAGAGDVAKSYFGYKWTGVKERMLSVSLFDKTIAIASIGVLGIYSLYKTGLVLYGVVIFISFLPFLFLAFYERIQNINILKRILVYLNRKVKKIDLEKLGRQFRYPLGLLSYTFLISLLGWIATYLLMYYCMKIAGVPITFETILVMSPLITLGRLFPFTLNGIGSDEAIIVYLFSQGNPQAEESLILLGALLYRLVVMVLPALGGIYFIFSTKKIEF